MTTKPKFLDSFCGLGGVGLGAASAGYKVAVAINHSPHAKAAHQALAPEVPVELDDINNADWDRYRHLDVAHLHGSPSCKPHSKSHCRVRTRRNQQPSLFGDPSEAERMQPLALVEAASVLRPPILTCENVVEMHNEWELYRTFLFGLRDLGYTVQARVWNSRFHLDDTGKPIAQSRDRLLIVASRPGLNVDLDFGPDTHCPSCEHTGPAVQTWLRPVTDLGVPDKIGLYSAGSWWWECRQCRERVEPPQRGCGTILDLHDVGEPARLDRLGAGKKQRIEGALATLRQRQFVQMNFTGARGVSLDEPLNTVTAKDHKNLVSVAGDAPFDWDRPDWSRIHIRPLHPHELARAQGLPDTPLPLNRTNARKAIGNAVPPAMARDLCSRTLAALAA